jgi:hypothetical protein
LLAVASALGLTACVDSEPANYIAREAAKDAVRPVLQRRLPGVPVEPAVNCVIDNATASEILSLAEDGVTGTPDDGTVRIVSDIVRRQGTIDCLIREGLPALLAR